MKNCKPWKNSPLFASLTKYSNDEQRANEKQEARHFVNDRHAVKQWTNCLFLQ